jgi:hypothetical protein
MSANGWPIPTASLQMASFPLCPWNTRGYIDLTFSHSSILIILTKVANAMALLKSHLPDLNMERLRKDFTVDEAECEALTNGAYDAAHEFTSSYDFSSLAESKDNDSPRNM